MAEIPDIIRLKKSPPVREGTVQWNLFGEGSVSAAVLEEFVSEIRQVCERYQVIHKDSRNLVTVWYALRQCVVCGENMWIYHGKGFTGEVCSQCTP